MYLLPNMPGCSQGSKDSKGFLRSTPGAKFIAVPEALASLWSAGAWGGGGGWVLNLMALSSVHFSHSVVSDSLRSHGRQHARPPCPSPPPLLKLMSIELVMPSNHLILCLPLLLPPSTFPRIRVFSNESFLRIRWPKYCSFSASASVLPSYGTGSHKISHWK